MALDKLPVEIEIDRACDRFVDECRKNGNKVVTTELTRLVKHTSFLITEDAMSTAMERFEARMDAMEKSQNLTRWVIGIGIAFLAVVIAITSRQPQPTQNQQPPVQQQQVQPSAVQPVQPQQTVEPVEQNSGAVSP